MNEKPAKPTDEFRAKEREAPEFYIATLNRQIRENMNAALRVFGLKLADWRLLQCMERSENLSIADLAELAVIERSVASRLVDKLVAKGLVSKQVDKVDRRFTVNSITVAGSEALAQTAVAVDDLREQLFRGLSAAEYEGLLRSLQTVKRNAKAYDRLAGSLRSLRTMSCLLPKPIPVALLLSPSGMS